MPPKMVWERLQDLPFDGGSNLTCKAVGDYFLVLRREDCAAVVLPVGADATATFTPAVLPPNTRALLSGVEARD